MKKQTTNNNDLNLSMLRAENTEILYVTSVRRQLAKKLGQVIEYLKPKTDPNSTEVIN